MSSILKAMKKIENESMRPAVGGGRPTSGDVEKIMFGKTGGSRRHPFFYLFLPALSVLIVSVMFYLYNERNAHNKEAAALLLVGSDTLVPVQGLTSVNAKKSQGHDRIAKKEVAVSSRQRDMKETDARNDTSHAPPPLSKEPEYSPEKESVASGTGPQYAETAADDSLPKAMDLPKGASWYKVHGISWSDDPARRIAVINSSVVHEGERVEGGLVVKIEKNSVVIKRENTLYNVPF